MGFLGKIFGGKGEETVELSLDEASSFLEGVLSGRRKALLDSFGRSVAEVRHVLLETRHSLDALVSAEAVARSKRLEKIVETSRNNALVQLGSLLEKLEPPNTGDLNALRDFVSSSVLAMKQSSSFGKNVAYAGIGFREELKAVSGNLHRLGELFSGMKGLLEENKAVFLEASFSEKMSSLENLRAEVSSLEGGIASVVSSLEACSAEEAKLKLSLKRLGESPGFREIDSLNERKAVLLREKQAAKTEILGLFARVEKPLHRLDKAVKAGKFSLPRELASLLELVLVNPFKALRLDPKAVRVKAVLGEAARAVESNVVELKAREREKKLAVLRELVSFDFFAETFWKFNRIDSDIQAVERRLESLPAVSEEASILASLKSVSGKGKSLQSDLEAKRARLSAAASEISSLRVSLQSVLCRVSGKRVVLRG